MSSPFQYIGGPAAVIGNAVGDVGKTLEELHQQSYENQLAEQNAQTENEKAQLGFYGKMGAAQTAAESREEVERDRLTGTEVAAAFGYQGKLGAVIGHAIDIGVVPKNGDGAQSYYDLIARDPGKFNLNQQDLGTGDSTSSTTPSSPTQAGGPVPTPPSPPTKLTGYPSAPGQPASVPGFVPPPGRVVEQSSSNMPPGGLPMPPVAPDQVPPNAIDRLKLAQVAPGIVKEASLYPGADQQYGILAPLAEMGGYRGPLPGTLAGVNYIPGPYTGTPPPGTPVMNSAQAVNSAPIVPSKPGSGYGPANPANAPVFTQQNNYVPPIGMQAPTVAKIAQTNSMTDKNIASAQELAARSGLLTEQARLAPGIANALVNVHNAQAKADILRAGTAEQMVGVAAQRLGMQGRELQLRTAAESDPQLKSALSIYAMGTKYLGSESGALGIDTQTRQNVMRDMSNAYQIIRQRMSAQQATPGTPASPNMPSITQIKPLNPLSQGVRTWNGPPVWNATDYNRLSPQQKQEYMQLFHK